MLVKFIKESYDYQIFNWDYKDESSSVSTTFRPNDLINSEELITVMVKLITNTVLEKKEWQQWFDPYKIALQQYAKVSRLNNIKRWNIAVVLYDLYKNNDYELKDVWYVIK
jgi:hypothetical protein